MSVSVIIPLHRCASTLPRCLDALAAQRFEGRLDVVCIDNNSPDPAADIAREMRARVLTETRQGAYAARNTGIRAAEGSILLFTDPDCVPDPDWVSAHVDALARPGSYVTLGRVDAPEDGGVTRLLGPYEHARHTVLFGGHDPARYFGYANNMGVRRELLTELGDFEERRRGADTVLVQTTLRHLGTDAVSYVPGARVTHTEIASARAWLGKMALYGRSSRLIRDRVETRPADWTIKLRAFRAAVREARMSPGETVGLALLLSGGVVAWQIGYRTLVSLPDTDPASLALRPAEARR